VIELMGQFLTKKTIKHLWTHFCFLRIPARVELDMQVIPPAWNSQCKVNSKVFFWMAPHYSALLNASFRRNRNITTNVCV